VAPTLAVHGSASQAFIHNNTISKGNVREAALARRAS
jgi:hypothetical protein